MHTLTLSDTTTPREHCKPFSKSAIQLTMFTNLKRRLRNTFITGILITVPVAFTLFILNFLFRILDDLVVPWFIKWLIRIGTPIPEDFHLPGLGLVLIILLIFVAGVVTKSFLGGKLVQLGEMIVDRIPVVRSLYTGAKQGGHHCRSRRYQSLPRSRSRRIPA